MASVGPTNGAHPNRHAEAGRLGAKRVHQLIRLGRVYEEEHGLNRGRERLRQLVQFGKRYEQEHGLAASRPRKRRGKGQAWDEFLTALARVVKPSYRPQVERLVQELRSAAQPTPAVEPAPADTLPFPAA
jgi:hypothetical protein